MEDFERKLNEIKLKIKNIQTNINNIKFNNSNHNEINKFYKRHKTAHLHNHVRNINSFDEVNNRRNQNINPKKIEDNNMKNNYYNNINDSNRKNNGSVFTQYKKKEGKEKNKNNLTYNFEYQINNNKKDNIPFSNYATYYKSNTSNVNGGNLFKLEKKHFVQNNLLNDNINKTYDNTGNKNNIFDFENNKIQENFQYDNLQKYYHESKKLKNNMFDNNNTINDYNYDGNHNNNFLNNNTNNVTGNSFRKKFIPRKRNKTPNQNNINNLNTNPNSTLNNTDLTNTYNKTVAQNKPKAISNRYSYDLENNEEIINEMIEITNNYNELMRVNKNNLIEQYKIILREIKLKNEFINKIYDLYNNGAGNILDKNNESLITLWNWIKTNVNNNNYIQNKIFNDESLEKTLLGDENVKQLYTRKNKCYTDESFIQKDEYKNLCEGIMKDYNLKNIKELRTFIKHLLNKQNKNDNFLEGIKKILLTGNQFK